MFRESLRYRLLAAFIGVALVPLIFASVIIEYLSFDGLVQQSIDLQGQVAAKTGSEIKLSIDVHRQQLEALAEVRGLAELDQEQQEAVLQDLLAYDESFQEIALLDHTGQELMRFSRTSLVAPGSLKDRSTSEEFVASTSSQEFYYGAVFLDRRTREPLMTMALPITDSQTDGTALVLVVKYRFSEIWRLLAEANFPHGSNVYVIDQSGAVIAHPDPGIMLANTTVDPPSENGRGTGLDGNDVILASERLTFGNQEFIIVAEQPEGSALQLATDNLYVAVGVTVVALFGAALVAVLTTGQMVRPIEQLSHVAKAIREGNLDQRAKIHGQDEIGKLAETFNEMTQQLQDLIKSLESRVKARTRDLRVAGDVSRQITTVLNIEALLPQLVDLTTSAFDLYHVSVFLYDESTEKLVLSAGTGEAGQQMMQTGKSFLITDTKGLVPKSAHSRNPIVVNNVRESKEHFVNPVLPETMSEIALPMVVGDRLVGVLDIQSREQNRFHDYDIEILSTLSEQIAIAVRNTQLYAAASSALEEAEQANRVKSQFLASMSHELRTPLNGIMNFTGVVADGMLGPVNDKQEKFLKDAVHNAEHLLSLINDVLDISKIESGSLKLFVEDDIDIAEILQDVARTGQTLLHAKPVELELEIQDNLPPIRCDKRRVRQILLNIMSNACKFTEKGSIKFTASTQNDEILISVKDTGPGIAPEEHKSVFETFLQTETGVRKGGGTGLGMPISKRLAEAHGGNMCLESQEGAGATFTVTLPVQSTVLEPTISV